MRLGGAFLNRAMLPSSTIRVLQQSGSLIVVCPPFYMAAIASLIVTIFATAAFFTVAGGIRSKWTVLIVLGLQVPFILIGIGLATTGAVVVLDPSLGTAQIRRRIFGIPMRTRTFALTSVRQMFVERGRGTGRLALLMK